MRKWCPGAESNHRHADFQSAALPTELPGHPGHSVKGCPGGRMAPEVVGFIVDIELSVQSRRAANRTLRGRSVPKGSHDRLVPGFSPQRPPGALAPWDGRANPLPASISMGSEPRNLEAPTGGWAVGRAMASSRVIFGVIMGASSWAQRRPL